MGLRGLTQPTVIVQDRRRVGRLAGGVKWAGVSGRVRRWGLLRIRDDPEEPNHSPPKPRPPDSSQPPSPMREMALPQPRLSPRGYQLPSVPPTSLLSTASAFPTQCHTAEVRKRNQTHHVPSRPHKHPPETWAEFSPWSCNQGPTQPCSLLFPTCPAAIGLCTDPEGRQQLQG